MVHGLRLASGLGVVFLMAALAVSCSRDSDDLSGTDWVLATLNGSPALADIYVAMTLGSDDELFGSGGCNRFTGTWNTGDDGALTLNASGMTMMACEEQVSSQETAFMEALAGTTRHQRDGDELTLRNDADEELAVLHKLTRAELTDTEWEVTGYNNGQEAVVSVIDDTRITATFDDDDQLNGNAGCNTYMASYSIDDDEITIEQVAATQMACDEPVMDQEMAYLVALEQAATFELGENTLELRADDGALLVSYRAAE